MNIIDAEKVQFLIIDVQDKLVKMLDDEEVSKNCVKLAKTFGILKLPVIITEQYPKGLGSTIEEIKENLPNAEYIEKTSFSAYEEIKHLLTKKQVVLFGIETHICVLQTAFDLLKNGYEVFIVQCACGSRTKENKDAALRRLIHGGAEIVTVETVIFELLRTSKHPNFKEIQAIIK